MAGLAENPRPKAIVFEAEILDHPSVGQAIRHVVETVQTLGVQVIVIGEDQSHDLADAISYEKLIARNVGRPWDAAITDENTPAFLFHTSGTTGPPKTYQVTHRQVMLNCLSQATVEATGLSSHDRVLPLAPFFHVNGWGLPLTCALTGASLVLPGSDLNPVRITNLMDTERVTAAAAVPTVWYNVCAAIRDGKVERPQELREIMTGGDALPKSVWQSIQNTLKVGVATAWGMTETMACSTYERRRPYERAGKPIPLLETKLEGLADSTNGESAPARLQVRGPFVIGNRDDANGWFTTGDIASVDNTGALILRDREKDLIKSGGEWIASAELEQELAAHPFVTSAAVVPISDPQWIQRPVAYVVPSDPSEPDEMLQQVLTAYLAEKFPRWWLPDHIHMVASLPTTTVGKINKRALRQMAETTQEEEVTHVK